MAKKLTVDIAAQAELGKEVPPESDVVGEVFKLLRQTANALHERGGRRGALIVIGTFASAGEIADARGDLRPNPFKGQYVSAGDKFFQRMILQGDVGEGAVIADESGQILGGGIMLVIDHPDADVPQGGFMRHLAAASTSMRKGVKAVLTLSEENNIARVFQDGKVAATFDPAAAVKEEPAAEAPLPQQAPLAAKPTTAPPPDASPMAGVVVGPAQPASSTEATHVVPPPVKRRSKRTTARKRRKKGEKTQRIVKDQDAAEAVEPDAACETQPGDETHHDGGPAQDTGRAP